ncbi:MAG: bifunctional aldolase/short-chain dehydrogenase [Chitinispirillaceae bacterium]|jgi:rhamnose utilization protein RhaD (predicted bifunctional aldolase and dehydrogenase)/NAD(P)-dependent dehydrogenase (short-subunit alcohol dehydrogenase family)
MKNRWSDKEMESFVKSCGSSIPPEFVRQIYATRLLGVEPDLVLHGGGNTSLKLNMTDLLGETRHSLAVKASGVDMANAAAGDFVALDLDKMNSVRKLKKLGDEEMTELFRLSMLRPSQRMPSIETLLHLFLPYVCIDHTHPSAVLALTNRNDAAHCLHEAFGTRVIVIPYVRTGLECAQACLEALRNRANCSGIVIMNHGLVTWGETAAEAYQTTIKLVSLAETFLAGEKVRSLTLQNSVCSPEEARVRYEKIAPIVRGLLSPPSGNADTPYIKVVLRHLVDEQILELLSAQEAFAVTATTPLTPDYLIRVSRLPLFIEQPSLENTVALRDQIAGARDRYLKASRSYMNRQKPQTAQEFKDSDLFPRVILLPGVGCICTSENALETAIAADIMTQAFSVKRMIYETGGDYAGISDEHCFDMEFRSYQRAKVDTAGNGNPVAGAVVLVTGAAGAIGAGICSALLEEGYHVGVSDLAGSALDMVVKEFSDRHGNDRVLAVPMDVTDPASVEQGFASIITRFGGLDGVVVNAGVAHVAMLADMDLEAFKKLEKVNIEGTLLTIREAAKIFKLQNTGGDIVLISTKNVFAPGASFGAYSATKAAAHQLARIASIELAEIGVRVNMVAPDAVFSHGSRKSGLWATVGPDRMRSRGLDEAGLEEYYRKRNLLKAKVTAEHVAAAVLFFLSHKTPTTGATIPVDGGLPDSTPR